MNIPVMKRNIVMFMLTIFMMFFKSDMMYSDECDFMDCEDFPGVMNSSVCKIQESSGWNDELFCSLTNKDSDEPSIICDWRPMCRTVEYTLYISWSEYNECSQCTTTSTSVLIKDVYPNQGATIWVSTGTSMISKNFSIIIKATCDTKILQAVHSPNELRFMLDNAGEVRYRETTSSEWHYVKSTLKDVNVSLAESWNQTSFIAQQRCLLSDTCDHCEWGRSMDIPHKLIETPIITITTEQKSPGKQRVSVKWKFMQSEHVDGYSLDIQRVPLSCKMSKESYNLNKTDFHIESISMAYFKISKAYNKAGASPKATSIISALPEAELPGKLFATVQENKIFLTWSPKFNDTFFVIDWGTNHVQMKNNIEMEHIENYTLSGPFEAMKRYTIMIHLYEGQTCGHFTKESTFGITHVYAVEGVPRAGPDNITITNITKYDAVIQWNGIPEEDCLGILLGYRLHYTDISNNKTLDVFLNSSMEMRYELKGLKRGSEYEVKLSGMTSKGEGTPSSLHTFRTLQYAEGEFEIIIIVTFLGMFIIVLIIVNACACTINRTKHYYIPKIPNPKYSSTAINGAATVKSRVLPSLIVPQEETICIDPDFQVIEEILIETSPMDSQIYEEDGFIKERMLQVATSISQKNSVKFCENPKTSSAFPREDYTSMMFMMKEFKKSSQLDKLENTLTGNVSAKADKTPMGNLEVFYDYVRDIPSMDLQSNEQTAHIQLMLENPTSHK